MQYPLEGKLFIWLGCIIYCLMKRNRWLWPSLYSRLIRYLSGLPSHLHRIPHRGSTLHDVEWEMAFDHMIMGFKVPSFSQYLSRRFMTPSYSIPPSPRSHLFTYSLLYRIVLCDMHYRYLSLTLWSLLLAVVPVAIVNGALILVVIVIVAVVVLDAVALGSSYYYYILVVMIVIIVVLQ